MRNEIIFFLLIFLNYFLWNNISDEFQSLRDKIEELIDLNNEIKNSVEELQNEISEIKESIEKDENDDLFP